MLTVGFVDPGVGRLLERIAWWLHCWLALLLQATATKSRLVIVLSRLCHASLPRYCMLQECARAVSPRPLLCTIVRLLEVSVMTSAK